MLALATGASSNHFVPLLWLLESVFHYAKGAQVVVFDLGLTDLESTMLRKLPVEYIKFPFPEFPPHVAELGKFAWKPLAIQMVLEQYGAMLWLDAGDQLTAPLTEIEATVERDGIYIPQATIGKIRSKTLRPTQQHLGMSEEIGEKRFRHAAVIGIHPRRQSLVQRWADLALLEDVIAPEGAARGNHHFDQSILSILVHQTAEEEGLTLENSWLGVTANNDDKRPPGLPPVSYQPLR